MEEKYYTLNPEMFTARDFAFIDKTARSIALNIGYNIGVKDKPYIEIALFTKDIESVKKIIDEAIFLSRQALGYTITHAPYNVPATFLSKDELFIVKINKK